MELLVGTRRVMFDPTNFSAKFDEFLSGVLPAKDDDRILTIDEMADVLRSTPIPQQSRLRSRITIGTYTNCSSLDTWSSLVASGQELVHLAGSAKNRQRDWDTPLCLRRDHFQILGSQSGHRS